MKLSERSCREFAELLASREAVPGGGAAAAFAGALGIALNSMVANFSIGKKRFAHAELRHREILRKGASLRNRLIALIDEDAENFLPLSAAYGLPSATEDEKRQKKEVMEQALKAACAAPMEMMERIYESILLHGDLVEIASKIVISDVGVGVKCLEAALHGARMNVIINLNAMEDEEYASSARKKTEELAAAGQARADEIFRKVMEMMDK